MDLKKFIENQGLSDSPVGLGGCRNLDYFFDSCDYDLMVFDENSMFFRKNIIFSAGGSDFGRRWTTTSRSGSPGPRRP